MGALKFFVIAGEPSGDALGAALMAGLKTLKSEVVFEGVGGAKMAQEGLRSIFPMEELSLMGLAEVLPQYFNLKRRINEAAHAALSSGAAALITIDSPDFCLRVARLVKAQRPQMRIIHYVAPSVWAWRPGRAQKMAQVVDHVLALLPFEPPYMQAAGMSCDFVGHPIVAQPVLSRDEAARMMHWKPKDTPLVLMLPGSRIAEITRMAPVFGQTLPILQKRYPHLRAVVPTLPHIKNVVEEHTAQWPITPMIVTDTDQKRAAFARADIAIAASGTVSLELAAQSCPMVIAYAMNPLSAWIIKRALRVDTVTLVNLVSQSRAVPEFLQDECRPDTIAEAALGILDHGAPLQRAAMEQTMKLLGRGDEDPGLRAARSVLSAL